VYAEENRAAVEAKNPGFNAKQVSDQLHADFKVCSGGLDVQINNTQDLDNQAKKEYVTKCKAQLPAYHSVMLLCQ
jgi:hypothetical protein